VIELNLLPKEMRKPERPVLPEMPVLPISIGVLALLVFVSVVLFLSINLKKGGVSGLTKQWDALGPQRTVVEKIVRDIQDLESREKAISELAAYKLDWSELLSGLNQSMIANVWLFEFKPVLAKKKTTRGKGPKKEAELPASLDLTGYAFGKSEAATSTVAKFINSLKNHKEFSKYFEEIGLDSVRKQVYKDEDVMRFKLICKFKDNI